jgi:hypothetical protein
MPDIYHLPFLYKLWHMPKVVYTTLGVVYTIAATVQMSKSLAVQLASGPCGFTERPASVSLLQLASDFRVRAGQWQLEVNSILGIHSGSLVLGMSESLTRRCQWSHRQVPTRSLGVSVTVSDSGSEAFESSVVTSHAVDSRVADGAQPGAAAGPGRWHRLRVGSRPARAPRRRRYGPPADRPEADCSRVQRARFKLTQTVVA